MRKLGAWLLALARRLSGSAPRREFSECLTDAIQVQRTSLPRRADDVNRFDGRMY